MSREQELEKVLREIVESDGWLLTDSWLDDCNDTCNFCGGLVVWSDDQKPSHKYKATCPIRRAQELLGEEEEKSWVKK